MMICHGITKRRGVFSAGGFQLTTPEWFEPDVYGAQLGAAAHAIVGSSWGDWVTVPGDMACITIVLPDNASRPIREPMALRQRIHLEEWSLCT